MITPSPVTIFVLRNTGGAYYAQATITNYSSLTYERSLWGIGQFQFTMAANILGANSVEVDALVVISDTYGTRSDRLGVVNAVERHISESSEQVMTVRGMEMKGILGWRLINPGTSDRYTDTDSAEGVMKAVVDSQCVNAVNSARNIPGLTIATDQDRGSTYTMSERWSSLAGALQACGQATGVGWTIYWTGSAFIFDVIIGKDRTMGNGVNAPLVISSDYDTAKESTYSQTKESYKNLSYTLGQGVGKDRVLRTIYTGSAEPVGLLRREMYVDARDLVTTGELDARGAQKLFENNYTTAVESVLNPFSISVAASQVDLGDTVTVQYFDFSQTSRVTGITEQWSEAGYDVQLALDKQPEGIGGIAVGAVKGNTFTQTATETPSFSSAGDVTLGLVTVNTGIVPDANDGAYLGSTTRQFSDLFLAEGGVINWDNGDAIITQTGNVVNVSGAELQNEGYKVWSQSTDGNGGQPPAPKPTEGTPTGGASAPGQLYTGAVSGGNQLYFSGSSNLTGTWDITALCTNDSTGILDAITNGRSGRRVGTGGWYTVPSGYTVAFSAIRIG